MIAASALVALGGSLVAGVADARTGLIPDVITRTTALAALGCAVVHGVAPVACAGAYAVGGALLALHMVTGGRGLGLGDVKLGTAIGAGFGPSAGLLALGASFVLGGAYASWLLLTRRGRRGDAIRFGPFLAAGTIAVALFHLAVSA
ncbi:MAG TPA: A24 family peptidase [Dongiaceae bacterium]|nr:A24 family peptidase [Dongiaceae bacterium]